VDKKGISHVRFEEVVAVEEHHEIPSIATQQNARTVENHATTDLNAGLVLQTKETNKQTHSKDPTMAAMGVVPHGKQISPSSLYAT
jgi:hypothetical protein